MTGVSAILQQMAENAGKAALVRGNTYATLVQQAANVPAQIMDDQEKQQIRDLQQAQDRQRMALAIRADQRATADQAYQDLTRGQQIEHDRIVRIGLAAAMGPDGDPSQFDAKAAFQAVSRLGRPEAMTDVIAVHQKMQPPRPYETDPTKDLRDPVTNAIIKPGTGKIPTVGSPEYEIYLRSLANQPAPDAAPGAPASSAAAPGVGAPTYAARADLLQNGPPAPAPADVPAFDAGGTFTGPTTYGPAPAAIAPPMLTPPAAAAPTDYGYGPRYGTTTPKGLGYLGPLQRPDNGKTMSEYSIGVNIGGKETQIPSIVPTLTQDELTAILTAPEGTPPPASAQQKAIAYAKTRIAKGLDPFAGPGEQQNLFPALARNPIPTPQAAAPGAPPAVGALPAPSARPLTQNEATLKAYADQRKAIEDAKDPHSSAYKEWQDYKAQGGALAFDAYMTMDANRKRPQVSLSGLNSLYTQTDPKEIAAAIIRGERDPETGRLGRPIGAAVETELAKQGYNQAQAITDWKATQRYMSSRNSTPQLKLNQSINALPDLFDSVDSLASQWKAGHYALLNKANLALAKQGAYGPEAASIAVQLEGQIADTVSDLGTVYMGGNSPTDHGLKLAETALRGEWDEKVLHDMVKLGKSNVIIRRNSINNTGVAGASATNPYYNQGNQGGGPGVTPPATTTTTTRVTQNGVTFDVTRDATGAVISSTVVK